MKRKLLFALSLCLIGGGSLFAQTDVTDTYIKNADFTQGTPLASNVHGYAHDALKISDTTPYGLQAITGWTAAPTGVTDGEDPAKGKENVAAMGAIFEYGSEYQMKGNNTVPPTAGPNGETGTCLGIAGVWGANAQYYQEVTLSAGIYVFTVTYYSQSGTQANTSLFGFIEDDGTSHVVPSNPATGGWKTESVTFTLLENTSGKISVGYKSSGNGSGANPHLYVDNIKLTKEDITAPTLPLRAEFGGSTVDLGDFVVGNGDYTLEVEGTVGTAINIAADNISYTPTTSGNVRFVKYNGVVYAYEDGFFTKAVASSKATATFTDLTGTNVTTSESNLLSNASFETVGSSVGDDIYNIGTPWTSNVTMKSGGIRVGKNNNAANGNYVLVWRGSGNSNYISQPLTTLKPLRQYQVKMQQVASGNANANFNVGIGSAAGEYSLTSTTVKLGTGNDGTKTISFATPSSIVNGETYYFTFRNTSNNTASTGNDPVAQIDWISLVCQDALAITGATSAVYLDGTAYAPTSAKEAYEAVLAEARAAIANSDYTNVTGSEKTALQTAIDAEVADNKDAYNAATLTLSAALDAFTGAKAAYDGYVSFVEGTTVPDLAYASAAKKTAIDNAVAATPASAGDVDAKKSAITTALRAYYESHALAEGVDGAVNYNAAIADANADKKQGWTGTIGTNTNEGYTGSDGVKSTLYLDGGWASNAGANIDIKRTVELPAGKYLLTVKVRGALDLTVYTLSIAGETINLPHANGGSNGTFGNGWEDASIEFTTDGKAQTLEIIAKSTASQQWMSINDFRLVQLELNSSVYAGETEYAALNSAITAAEAKTLGFEAGQYAPYNNVAALEALAAAKAIDPTAELTNLKDDVTAATKALTDASWTVNEGAVDIIYNGNFAEANGHNPKGWTRSNNAWGQQQTGLTAEANGVNEGTTTAWYYNSNGAWEYGKDDVYKMPLAGNQLYKLSFKYRKHGGDTNNWMKASVLTADGKGFAAVQFPGASDGTRFQEATAYFTLDNDADYILSIEQYGNAHVTDVSLVKATAAETKLAAQPANYTYYQTLTLGRTFSTEDWSTICLPFDLDVEATEDAFSAVKTLSAVTDKGADANLTFADATEMAAGTPYLVKAKNAEVTLSGVAVDPAAAAGKTEVKEGSTTVTYQGTFEQVNLTSADGDCYIVNSNKIYHVASNVTVGAYRAYFKVATADGGVKALTFDLDGEATGLQSVEASEQLQGTIYNLAGQRVNKAQKGIFIVNGKKVIK